MVRVKFRHTLYIENTLHDSLPGLAAIDTDLQNDITIVISVKDSYYIAKKHLGAVLEMAPGVPLVYVLSEPVNKSLKKAIVQAGVDNSHITVLDTGLLFSNPYVLRNLAIPLVNTRYTLFLFNDVFPLGEDWLSVLHSTAEENPDVDIFQPFIWEYGRKPHAAWDSLTLDEAEGELFVKHTFNTSLNTVKDPASELKADLQCCYLEDHAFMIRTENLKKLSILDPGAAYTKEFLDMAFSARFTGSIMWSVPASQVVYESRYALGLDDVLLFSYRRCEELSLGSLAYICKKWGVRHWSGRIWDTFIDTQLGAIAWGRKDIPELLGRQVELLLALFVSIGFNRFCIAYDSETGNEKMPALTLPEAYKIMTQVSSAGGNHPVSITPAFCNDIPVFSASSNDHEDRRNQLRSGRLFPVHHMTRGEAGVYSQEITYKRSSLIECFDIRINSADATDLFDGISSMVLEKKVTAHHSVFRVFFHARQFDQQKDTFDKLSRDLANYAARQNGLLIDGRFYSGAGVRVVDCMEGNMLPVELGVTDQDWKIIHWSWKVYNFNQIADMFNMYTWRRAAKDFLRQLRKQLVKKRSLGFQAG